MEADERLVAELARDLDSTFERLVTEHQDRLYSIALRVMGDPRDAEEAAQDALVRAYRALAGYPATRILELRLRPWLATIVLNVCRSRRARAKERLALSLDLAMPTSLEPRADESSGPAAITDRRVQAEVWAARLMDLPRQQREAIVLRHVDGLSYPEMAAALGRPEGTVKAHVHRGLAHLRTAYEGDRVRHLEEMTA